MSPAGARPVALAALALVLALLAPAAARAGGDVAAVDRTMAPAMRRTGAALSLLALHDRGLAGEGELMLNPRFSLAAGLGLRSAAAGDYSSFTLAAAGEVRRWLKGRAVASAARGMVGWYLAGRVDLSHTSERNTLEDRDLGAHLALSESLLVGYRFALWRRLTITPSTGLSLRTEFDLSGRLSPWTRGGISAALTAGWLF